MKGLIACRRINTINTRLEALDQMTLHLPGIIDEKM
jgi:hypothetical protein